MYKNVPFRTRPQERVLAEIDAAAEAYRDQVRTVFLPDGNTIVLKTEKLLPILARLKERFPHLERVTCYGSARFVIRKSPDDLKRLKEAGLTRIHMGIESGDAETLEKIRKGAAPEQMIEAGCRAREAGMEVSEYILVGIAGHDRSRAHAKASAAVLNAIQPRFVRLRTFVPVEGTPMWKAYENGSFKLLSPHECLREIRALLNGLEAPMELVSDHISNHVNVRGRIPEDRQRMVEHIEKCLDLDEDEFRGSLIGAQL
jgi:radical SAM superfamily enzyme YgiQ (UPF0313 family)